MVNANWVGKCYDYRDYKINLHGVSRLLMLLRESGSNSSEWE